MTHSEGSGEDRERGVGLGQGHIPSRPRESCQRGK